MHDVSAKDWDSLLGQQTEATPFMSHAYLCAMEDSGSASAKSGWKLCLLTLRHSALGTKGTGGGRLAGAAALYIKPHSYGEYVFDWAWADAYQRHGLNYYPKAVAAVPFTPVPGSRLLADSPASQSALLSAMVELAQQEGWSSLHVLFLSNEEVKATEAAGWLSRHTVQFHWHNDSYTDFEHFLGAMNQEKRKKIKQERRKVSEAGVTFKAFEGAQIQSTDWDFFYKCYSQTYFEHGNAPYLSREFFQGMQDHMAQNWVLFIAEKDGQRIACSLIGLFNQVAYGRYWGALERVDCLHFEACYYQPIEWCIRQGVVRFEGGAQGEHKMARALLPVKANSAHWLAHPGFADAVERYLEKEGHGVQAYLENLEARSPLKLK
ncbi:GNAT family N-acetyltransferase [Limnohabitans sp. MMS-10A-178]|uniref:GNAT family N-acetyltransferase n=1 Tax=Limnohabitans sp. MMS-10A-178 TaxID=1835767 RepID=UPI000D3C2D11|nr:GNAT family N-acetyltransferase [Limnohabitans sp. MMS-10A-178]PUE15141.1 GNAT family N-acetyltransferase [Limnohabitans sp. MMS-10A-178]